MAKEELGPSEKKELKMLDADSLIDEIISKKGPHKYTGGLSESNWEQEIEQIPLFMTKSPEEVDASKSPALAALQDLKYQLNIPEGRARAHKEEGNEHFRLKRYQRAVEEYSAGLKEERGSGGDGCDQTLRAILYTNRAAAHFYLGNLRSCLSDVSEAKRLKPDHFKAIHRGALACMKLGRYGEALDWCDEGLRVNSADTKLRELRSKASKEKKHQERDQRKCLMAEKENRAVELKLVDAIKRRGIDVAKSISVDDGGQTSIQLMLEGSHPSGEKVHFDPEGRLIWPVLFLYPEHGQTDLISAFHEDQRFREHIEVMFGAEDRPPWDKDGTYMPDLIEIYFEESVTNSFVFVDPNRSLGDVISSNGYTVGAGTPSFFLLTTASPFTQHFLHRSS